MYTIEDFRAINKPENLVITQHSRKRFMERGISISDVSVTVNEGDII